MQQIREVIVTLWEVARMWGLPPNDKIMFTVVGSMRRVKVPESVRCHDMVVKRHVVPYIYLGVLFETQCSFCEHARYISDKTI